MNTDWLESDSILSPTAFYIILYLLFSNIFISRNRRCLNLAFVKHLLLDIEFFVEVIESLFEKQISILSKASMLISNYIYI